MSNGGGLNCCDKYCFGSKSKINEIKDEIANKQGFCDVRNFIVHDYDGVSMAVIEWLLRHGLYELKTRVIKNIKS